MEVVEKDVPEVVVCGGGLGVEVDDGVVMLVVEGSGGGVDELEVDGVDDELGDGLVDGVSTGVEEELVVGVTVFTSVVVRVDVDETP